MFALEGRLAIGIYHCGDTPNKRFVYQLSVQQSSKPCLPVYHKAKHSTSWHLNGTVASDLRLVETGFTPQPGVHPQRTQNTYCLQKITIPTVDRMLTNSDVWPMTRMLLPRTNRKDLSLKGNFTENSNTYCGQNAGKFRCLAHDMNA